MRNPRATGWICFRKLASLRRLYEPDVPNLSEWTYLVRQQGYACPEKRGGPRQGNCRKLRNTARGYTKWDPYAPYNGDDGLQVQPLSKANEWMTIQTFYVAAHPDLIAFHSDGRTKPMSSMCAMRSKALSRIKPVCAPMISAWCDGLTDANEAFWAVRNPSSISSTSRPLSPVHRRAELSHHCGKMKQMGSPDDREVTGQILRPSYHFE